MYIHIGTLFSLFLFCTTNAFAQKGKYNIDNIPPALLKNVTTIKREDIHEFEVKDINKARYKVLTTTTLLNESAKNNLVFVQYADKFHSLEEANIEVFDAKGISIKKYDKGDLNKQATGEGLVPDGKVYYLQIPVSSYPVTVKFAYEIKYKGILNYPNFEIQTPSESVEKAEYTAIVPSSLDLRYKAKNIIANANITNNSSDKIYNWQFTNLTSFNYEAGAVSRNDRYPQIILAPNKFELDDFEGDMSTWQNFGNWYGSLSKDANNLTEGAKQSLQKLVLPFTSDKEKIKAVYTYLQNNFRYVSIQLGIGGFKPFDADFVDKKKYGDCKALSNYTQACLAAVGIKSYQALINASYNEEPVDVAFPANQFNHVILCVPQPKDTLWLECTSNTNDFGVLGSFTENRNALLITENGGVLVATPKSNAVNNQYKSKTEITLQENGGGKANTKLDISGEYKQEFIHHFINQKYDDQKKYIVEELGFMEPYDFDIKHSKAELINISANFEKLFDFAAGKKLFINPRIYKIWNKALPNTMERKLDYYFEHPFILTDSTIYLLPQELSIETLPKNKSMVNEFGAFSTTYQYLATERKLVTTATLQLNQHKIPADKYVTVKRFFDEVMAEYNEKIVLKKL
jgi:hypothetical protein